MASLTSAASVEDPSTLSPHSAEAVIVAEGSFSAGYDSDSSDVVIVGGSSSLVSAQDMVHAMSEKTHAPVVIQCPSFVVLAVPEDDLWLSGIPYGIVPLQSLVLDPSGPTADFWYSVTKGQWVGVFSVSSLASDAVDGVSGNAQKKFRTAEAALNHFNATLGYGLVHIKLPKAS
ncbi:hypothetical protein C8J56DRAFT_1045659 [Mycena floridula]|nr:hypothetical protein C8J56DRAFT_1045659 [Mycena floridula]